MISLANGCVCCQIREDLVDSVAELIGGDDPVEYVILEASGVADPAGIYMTFLESAYRDRVRVGGVTCVVDAEQLLADDDRDVVKLKLQQIGFADLVIINKVDLAGVDGATAVKRWIDGHFKRVRLVPAIHCEVPLEVLLSAGRFQATPINGVGADAWSHDERHGLKAQEHLSRFSTQLYAGGHPLERSRLERMIKRELPANIYRCKRFVHLAHDPANRYVLQVVERRMDLVPDRPWGTDKPLTRIVGIAHSATIDPDQFSKLFSGCVAGATATETTESNGRI